MGDMPVKVAQIQFSGVQWTRQYSVGTAVSSGYTAVLPGTRQYSVWVLLVRVHGSIQLVWGVGKNRFSPTLRDLGTIYFKSSGCWF